MSNELENIIKNIEKEIQYAESKFPGFNSSHEGYAIILEEVDELWELVKAHSHDYKKEYNEAKQIACTAIRFMKMCKKHDVEL